MVWREQSRKHLYNISLYDILNDSELAFLIASYLALCSTNRPEHNS